MIEIVVVGEGPTEETFVKTVLATEFAAREVYFQARLIPTSTGAKGGALKRERVLRYLRDTLRQRADVYVTTLFDLYGLPSDFPGLASALGIEDPLDRATAIERQLAEEVVQAAECPADRFVPHIQPYEFEALLFSNVEGVTDVEPEWRVHLRALQAARSSAPSPEHINEGEGTHPSARLVRLLARPRYEKVRHGAVAARRIGLDRIRQECAHFAAWLDRMLALPALRAAD